MKKLLFVFTFYLINTNINAQWSNDATVNNEICNATDTQQRPVILSDGLGGAIIVWEDNRSGNLDIYVRKINSDGTLAWTTNGVAYVQQHFINLHLQ